MHSMTRPCVATSSSALTRTDGAGFLVVAALGQNLLLSKRKSLVLVSRWTACNARAIDVGSTQMMSELYADPRAVGKAKGKIAPYDRRSWRMKGSIRHALTGNITNVLQLHQILVNNVVKFVTIKLSFGG